MLSGGKVPFRGETSGTDGTTLRDRIYWEVMNLPYPPIQELNPKVPSAVDNVLRQSLQRNPNQRQRSVEEFYQQFSAAADKTVDPLRKPPVNPPIRGAYLVGLEGEWQGESLPITSAQFLLGRCSAANLHFNDSTVSRSHATILAARDGFWIRDENSKGGTFVNRHPVQRMQKLRSGDVIHITGGQCFRFIIQRSGR
jgi:serine/threonine protein kinase